MSTGRIANILLVTAAALLGGLSTPIPATVDDSTDGLIITRIKPHHVEPLYFGMPRIIYIDASASPGGFGLTWSNAFKYLQDGLSVAEYGDRIWVAAGTYTPDANSLCPDGTGDRAVTFQLKNGVGMYGGFPVGGGDWQDRDPNLYETILSGDIAGDDIIDPNKTENSYHVVTASGTDANTILDGFTITSGNAGSSEPDNRGAGMYNAFGNPWVANCTFTDNLAGYIKYDMYDQIIIPGEGGGMYNYRSNPRITNCQFINNCAIESGGAIYNDANSNPILTDCIFTDNTGGLAQTFWFDHFQAISMAFGKAGGILNKDGSDLTLINCTFEGNSTVESGGAMVNIDSSPMMNNCTFNQNRAPGNYRWSWPFKVGLGGGIVNYESNPTFSNCTFTNNLSGKGGGIYNDPNSCPVVTDCSFTKNIAYCFAVIQIGLEQTVTYFAGSGGGICNNGKSPTITNCIFTANQAMLDGGGMSNTNSSPAVIDCTFNGNLVTGPNTIHGYYGPFQFMGGGMSNHESNPTVTNCSFTKNKAGDGTGMSNDSNSCPLITDCVFNQNRASYVATFAIGLEQTITVFRGSGGGIYNTSSNPIVTNCAFTSNTVLSDGGGMSNFSSNPIVTNCTFTGNWAKGYTKKYQYPWHIYSFHLPGMGGAIKNNDSKPVLTNCTFADNRAEFGNAISFDPTGSWPKSGPSEIRLINCILWDGGDEIFNDDGSTITIAYSDVEGGWPGEGNIDSDPCFVDPGYWDPNSTPTDPNDDFWVDGDYHLNWLSPCFNAGDPNRDYSGQTDMDGEPRVCFGRVDIGADEVCLIAYWMMDDNAADVLVSDSSGNENHGTAQENTSALHDDGMIDGALTFNGISDYINLGSSATLTDLPVGDFTVSVWLYDESQLGKGMIAGVFPDGNTGWILRKQRREFGGYIDFWAGHSTTNAYFVTPQGSLSPDSWHYVAAVWYAYTKTCKIYIDGVESSYDAGTPGEGTYNSDATYDKEIGRMAYMDGLQFFAGRMDDLKIFSCALPAAEIAGLYETAIQTALDVDLQMNSLWMYQNLPDSTASSLTATVSIVYDPLNNSSYTHQWGFILPDDVTTVPTSIDGGTGAEAFCTFAAHGCDEPAGLSGSGQPFTVKVTVTGNDYGNTCIAEAQFGIALLGDVNNDGTVNVVDRSIINAFWRLGAAGPFTFTDCDINCSGTVSLYDRSIANEIWRGTLGQYSVSAPCPFR